MKRELLPGRHILPLRGSWADHEVVVETHGIGKSQKTTAKFPFRDWEDLPVPEGPSSPPAISGIRVLKMGRGVLLQTTIAWDTDSLTSGELNYGERGGPEEVLYEDHFATAHQLEISGLQ